MLLSRPSPLPRSGNVSVSAIIPLTPAERESNSCALTFARYTRCLIIRADYLDSIISHGKLSGKVPSKNAETSAQDTSDRTNKAFRKPSSSDQVDDKTIFSG